MNNADNLRWVDLLLLADIVTAEAVLTLAAALLALVLALLPVPLPAAALETRRPLPVAPLPPDLTAAPVAPEQLAPVRLVRLRR